MADETTAALVALRKAHIPTMCRDGAPCDACGQIHPCDTAQLLAAYDAAAQRTQTAEAFQRAVIDVFQPQRAEDPPRMLGHDVTDPATIAGIMDAMRTRVRKLTADALSTRIERDRAVAALESIRGVAEPDVDIRSDPAQPNLAMVVCDIIDAALAALDALAAAQETR